MTSLLNSVKKWYSDYKLYHLNEALSHFIDKLNRGDTPLIFEAIHNGLDTIRTTNGYDVHTLMHRVDILCEQVSDAISNDEELEEKYKSLKTERSTDVKSKLISIAQPLVLKIAEYYKDPDIQENIVPMLLMWIIEQSKNFEGDILNKNMDKLSDEFFKYLHKGKTVGNKSIPLIYLMASKIANKTKIKSEPTELGATKNKEVDVDTSRLVSSLMNELNSINEWAIDSPLIKSTETLDKKWMNYFKLIWKNPDLNGKEILEKIPTLPSNVKQKGRAPTLHGESVKRAGRKLINILSKHPRWKNKVGSLQGAIATLSQA